MTNFFTGSSTAYNPNINTTINTKVNTNKSAGSSPVSTGLDALFNVFTEAFGDNPLINFKRDSSLTNGDLSDENPPRQGKYFIA